MSGIRDKSPSEFWNDLVHADNSNAGISSGGAPIKLTDGGGQASSIGVTTDKLLVKPVNLNKTDAFNVETLDGSSVFKVDTTNSLVKAGTTQTIVNTQIAYFSIANVSAVSGTHYGMLSSGHSDAQNPIGGNFGTGVNPDISLTITTSGHNYLPTYFFVPANITIDSVQCYATDDSAEGTDDFNFHLMVYDVAMDNSATSGDLGHGVIKYDGSIADVGYDAIDYVSLTLRDATADVDADKILVLTMEMEGSGADLHCRGIMKYHFR